MPVSWVEHKGKRILFIDHEQTPDKQAMVNNALTAREMVMGAQPGILAMQDMTGTYISKEFMDTTRGSGKEVTARIDKMALIGVTGVKKVLLSSFVALTGFRKFKLFENRDDALEWLTE